MMEFNYDLTTSSYRNQMRMMEAFRKRKEEVEFFNQVHLREAAEEAEKRRRARKSCCYSQDALATIELDRRVDNVCHELRQIEERRKEEECHKQHEQELMKYEDAKCQGFLLIEASQLSLDDKFMHHRPTTDKQKKFKKLLTEAIKNGLSDFWHNPIDPSWNRDMGGLMFETGNIPCFGYSFDWWKEKAENYLSERGSRLGTPKEYVAYLGVLIKKLVSEKEWPIAKAWRAICDDSSELGHYKSKQFEPTGSREICGFYDLANMEKILLDDDGFYLASGCYYDWPDDSLATILHNDPYHPFQCHYATGWIVLPKWNLSDYLFHKLIFMNEKLKNEKFSETVEGMSQQQLEALFNTFCRCLEE